MRLSLLVLVAIAAFATPVYSLTLTPGTYKLEWRIPKPETGSHGTSTGIRPLTPDEAKQFAGLKSGRALIASIPEFVVLVDESKGTRVGL